MRYIRYARKSESDEGRQEKSIEQQREVMLQDAQNKGLLIVKEIEEAMSAKIPGRRKGYKEMVDWLKKGRADAILVYHENRLARNPLESGELQQLLQDGIIKEIRTHETIYQPEDNALLFAVISSMSNQYSRDLSSHVKRGMSGKRAEGWFPHRAPEGYLNNLSDHTIEADPDRFPLLRQGWEMMLSGSYSIAQVLEMLNGKLGYQTRLSQSKKTGGGPLSRSALYRLFTNVFYTGRWMENGVIYEGQHPPMVSAAEFNQVQQILVRSGKAQRKVHSFAYTGLIRCRRCGSSITAEVQSGRHGRGHYVYYHCASSRKQCSRVSVSEKMLEEQIDSLLQSITIHPTIKAIALEEIKGWHQTESLDCETVYEQQQKALLEAERRMNKLVAMYLNDLFDSDEEYKGRRAELQAEISRLKLEVAASEHEFEQITQTAENAFHFAAHAHENFLIGDIDQKREIAHALGLSYFFKEGEVTIDLHPALAAIYKLKGSLKDCIEPPKTRSGEQKEPTCEASVPVGWPGGTLLRTFKEIRDYFPRLWWMPQNSLLLDRALSPSNTKTA